MLGRAGCTVITVQRHLLFNLILRDTGYDTLAEDFIPTLCGLVGEAGNAMRRWDAGRSCNCEPGVYFGSGQRHEDTCAAHLENAFFCRGSHFNR